MVNRFKLGFGMVSNAVLRNPEVSLQEKALYAYLSTYADTNGELFVGVNKMASELGMGVSSVNRQLKALEDKGIIARISRGYHTSKITKLLK
jgi:DNA-binding MarR family transcriptional regulator